MKTEYKEFEERMRKSINSVAADFAAVRAGRANASVLDRIMVDYYGTPTPIHQIASIGSPYPRTLTIQPWDAGAVKLICKAIQESDLGINPQNDGKVIRLAFPQLTEERRKELVKQIAKYAEGGKVAIRNIRRDAVETFKARKKNSEITEDDMKIAEKDIQKMTDDMCKEIYELLAKKEQWAPGRRGLPRTAGHKVGSETFRTIATYCRDIGIAYLTVYAFSTENWRRPQDEVDTIMSLLKRYLLEAIDTMERDNVRLRFMGDMTPLSGELRELVDRCNAISDRLTGCLCSICINYGGRAEIVHGARAFAKDCAAGAVKPEDLTEEMFENYLYSAGIPSPDLLIRPGGELRLSNFLLWQCAYTEIYVTDVLWPDFSKEELHRAIASYQRRDRRFGGVKR